MTGGVSFYADVMRFGGSHVVGGHQFSLEPEIIGGVPDSFRYFHIKFLTTTDLKSERKHLSQWPLAWEFWTKNVSAIGGELVQDADRPWIYWQFPLVRWHVPRDRILAGRTMEGPTLSTPWLDRISADGALGRGSWLATNIPPPRP